MNYYNLILIASNKKELNNKVTTRTEVLRENNLKIVVQQIEIMCTERETKEVNTMLRPYKKPIS